MPPKAVSRSNSPAVNVVPPYEPSLLEYCEILRDYGLSGLSYFDSLGSATRSKVMKRLAKISVEDTEYKIRTKFSKAASCSVTSFGLLPMPKPGGSEVEMGFFLPRFRYFPSQKFSCSFCLLLWRDWSRSRAGKASSFRLEVADTNGAHSYAHVQLSRAIRYPDFKTDVEDWWPDSYPAFPLLTNSPIGMFLALVTALHGYDKRDEARYATATIRSSMQAASSVGRAGRIVSELDRLWPTVA
jgi:hypothetical protein